jgi:hypothetical protein
MDGLLGMIEGFANEVVGFAGVAVIELRDFIYDFVKVDRMHRTGYEAAGATRLVGGRIGMI